MNTSALLSVIVPVFKVEEYLDECVQSVVNQTYKNIEIILVDDGSPDCCPQICDEWAKKDTRIKVIHKENAGLGFARNSGILIASGKYVTFLDSDDFVDETCYEDMLTVLLKEDADCIKYGHTDYYNGRIIGKEIRDNKYRVCHTKEEIRFISSLIFENYPSKEERRFRIDASCCWGIFKTEIIKQYNIFFPSERILLSEDWIFHYLYLRHTNKLILHDNTYYHYRVNESSLSRKVDITRLKRAENLCIYIQQEMINDNFSCEEIMHIYSYYICILLKTMHNVYRCIKNAESRVSIFTEMRQSKYTELVISKYNTNRLNFRDKYALYLIKNSLWSLYRNWKMVNFIYRVLHKLKLVTSN